jgi:hypothetical protein
MAREGAADTHHVPFVQVPFRSCHLERCRGTPPVAQHCPFVECGNPGMVAGGGGAICGSGAENR